MKRALWISTIVVTLVSSGMAGAVERYVVTVRVATFRTIKGSLRCRLYAQPDGFPGKPPFVAEQSVEVSAKAMTCSFPSVAPGSYAVALFHDENGDGKLDTNFLGIPREGVGVSNNKFRSLGPPTFEDAKFALRGDLLLDVSLHY